ncbi:MAG: hypothetical protein R3296_05510 [Oleiphilaceae bacterium]|nr:hypothetical protein [Oleiphilaceae bacterium]
MKFQLSAWSVVALAMACLAMPSQAELTAKQEKRLKMLQMLDQMDQMDHQDFMDEITSAMDCIDSRNFNCARGRLEEARQYINTQEQQERLQIAHQSLDAAIEQVRKERQIARRMERERREQERLERERQEEWEREQERLAQEAEDHDPYSRSRGWAMALEITNAYTEVMTEKNRQRAQQIQQQQNWQAQQDNLAAQQRQQSRQQAEQYESNQRALQRELEAQRKAFAREQAKRRREAERTLSRAAAGSQSREPVNVGATSRAGSSSSTFGGGGSSASSYSGTSASSGSGSSASSRKKQKVYEPMPQVVTGETDTWFSDRDMAVAYSRLGAVNDVRDECRNKGARSDSVGFKDIKQGDTPGRWTYANPDCRQNGNGNWKCRAEVRTHCYRMQ